MASPESSTEGKLSFLNISLLPIKIHFFLAYGALGGVIPFLSVLIKGLGINATAVGIIYTILPFTVLLAKPSFGAVTDYFKNIRYVITTLLIITVVSYSFLLLIPRIQPKPNEATFKCRDNNTIMDLPIPFKPSCPTEQHTENVLCEMKGNICNLIKPEIASNLATFGLTCDSELNKTYLNFSLDFQEGSSASDANEQTPVFRLGTLDISDTISVSTLCNELMDDPSSITCPSSIDTCTSSSHIPDVDSAYKTYQFWTILILSIAGGTCSSALFSLSDTACYEVLGNKPAFYGKQRLWATVSWGTVALLTGYLNDLKSFGSPSPDYSPGFFLMMVLAVLDIVLLWLAKGLKKSSSSSNIFKDVRHLFTSNEVIVFALGVFIIGAFSGLLWTYEFWYLQNLGANQMLLGLTITVQCLAAEVPFFFFSGWIITNLGRPLCLILTFAAFSLRFFLYFILTNPWFVLPIEVLHGWTFGIFYATMTSYASHKAAPGTEATMQGVLGGLFEGLGVATGSLLGGVGFDQIGGHTTFLWASIVSVFFTLAFSIIMYFLKQRKRVEISTNAVLRRYDTNRSDLFHSTTSNLAELNNIP